MCKYLDRYGRKACIKGNVQKPIEKESKFTGNNNKSKQHSGKRRGGKKKKRKKNEKI